MLRGLSISTRRLSPRSDLFFKLLMRPCRNCQIRYSSLIFQTTFKVLIYLLQLSNTLELCCRKSPLAAVMRSGRFNASIRTRVGFMHSSYFITRSLLIYTRRVPRAQPHFRTSQGQPYKEPRMSAEQLYAKLDKEYAEQYSQMSERQKVRE